MILTGKKPVKTLFSLPASKTAHKPSRRVILFFASITYACHPSFPSLDSLPSACQRVLQPSSFRIRVLPRSCVFYSQPHDAEPWRCPKAADKESLSNLIRKNDFWGTTPAWLPALFRRAWPMKCLSSYYIVNTHGPVLSTTWEDLRQGYFQSNSLISSAH